MHVSLCPLSMHAMEMWVHGFHPSCEALFPPIFPRMVLLVSCFPTLCVAQTCADGGTPAFPLKVLQSQVAVLCAPLCCLPGCGSAVVCGRLGGCGLCTCVLDDCGVVVLWDILRACGVSLDHSSGFVRVAVCGRVPFVVGDVALSGPCFCHSSRLYLTRAAWR